MSVMNPTSPRIRSFAMVLCALLLAVELPAASHAKQSGATARVRAKLSADLLDAIGKRELSSGHVRVIVQGAGRNALGAVAGAETAAEATPLSLVDGFAASLSKSEILLLAEHPRVSRISLDREVLSSTYDQNHLRVTTGGGQVAGATGVAPLSGPFGAYLAALPAGMPSGAGVGIAVLDSGIRDDGGSTQDLRNLNSPGTRRVVAHVDFCSIDPAPPVVDGYDPYGHGTHVAATAAGNGRESISDKIKVGNEFSGMALGAHLVDVRVISGGGMGLTSDLIRGLDWMVANRDAYNIRVANLSVGAPVRESYRTDPLCRAVQAAIDAGITCVVAAGNLGKSATGGVVYGSILAPGNLPDAITVGAAKTWGTNVRSDDTVAGFSSRGPTLVDGTAKPDLVAPGDHVIGMAASKNALTTLYPSLVAYRKNKTDVYMQMSGTSVAAPVVAGTAALMLQANPNLTPAMVKAILRFTAQPLAASGDRWMDYLSEGAGLLNADGAVRVTRSLVASPASAVAGTDIVLDASSLRASLRPDLSFGTTVGGETFSWGTGILYSDGLLFVRAPSGDLQILVAEGMAIPGGYTMSNGYVLANRWMMSNGYVLANGWMMSSGYVLANGWTMTNSTGGLSDGFVLSESATLTDVFSSPSGWSSAVLDQSRLQTSAASNMAVDALGDDAPGNPVFMLGESSPLYPVRGRAAE